VGLGRRSAVRRLLITGGEPLLQRDALQLIVGALHDDGWTLEVETAGTLSPRNLADVIDQFTVSPKLANSGVARTSRSRPTVLREF
jgi:organic radical activating enzyme